MPSVSDPPPLLGCTPPLFLPGAQYAALLDVEPPTDGIFRAVLGNGPSGAPPAGAGGITQTRGNKWLVSLNLAGEG